MIFSIISSLFSVGNSIAYDVSRAFLEDLNVTEKVWIGLKKAENSERFVWSWVLPLFFRSMYVLSLSFSIRFHSNTKILDQESSYWAEQIPVTNVPLCAVIDPIHGFRWHSLHCGGPDVAAFLCELQGKLYHSICDWITPKIWWNWPECVFFQIDSSRLGFGLHDHDIAIVVHSVYVG